MGKRQYPTPPVTEADEGFLSRWSRRKSESRAESTEVETQSPPTELADVQSAPEPQVPITDADLPPLESLDEDSDFSGFLSPGVSDALRRRALRKLFSSGKFQVRDGLDDYDEDYRSFETLGNTLTANLRHRAQMEAERLARTEQAESAAEPEPAETLARTAPNSDAHESNSTEAEDGDPSQSGTRT